MKEFILSISLILSAQFVSAHEGHNKIPGMLKANHGGTMIAGSDINLEYSTSVDEVKIYPASHEGKDLDPANVKMSATVKAPKGNAEPLTLTINQGAFIGKINFKNAHRLEINITAETNGKKSSFKFQAEK